MFTRATTIGCFCVIALLTPRSTGANENAVFIELPRGVLPISVAANGTVVGTLRTGGGFYWMPTTGDIFLGGREASSVSRDGRTIVGTALDSRRVQQAAIWQRAAEWRLLGSIAANAVPCDDSLSTAYGTSADGRVVVGLGFNGCSIGRAFRWEEATGVVDLGSTVPGRSSRANGVSGDGQVVIGWQDQPSGVRTGVRWVDGRQVPFVGPSLFVGEALGTNMGGTIVVGKVCRFVSAENPLDQSAWVWTARDGVQCLEIPRARPGGFIGLALATSEDGRVIGGAHSFGLESESIIWIERQPSYLKDYLRSHGVPSAFEGWVNTGFVTGVSPDGRVVVGYGAGPRDFTGFVVILGEDR